MRKMFTAAAAAVATLAFSPAANAATTLSPIDNAPDGSFSFGFSGSQLGTPNFTESFTFTVASGLTGLLSSLIGTSTATATNDVDFTSVFISGGTLATPVQLTPMTGEPNETRSLGNGVTVGAGTYTYTVQGTRVGQNGSFGGNVSFAAATPAVPEPATWGMMTLGFAGLGYSMRRRTKSARIRFA